MAWKNESQEPKISVVDHLEPIWRTFTVDFRVSTREALVRKKTASKM
jgi:hypothetical protein